MGDAPRFSELHAKLARSIIEIARHDRLQPGDRLKEIDLAERLCVSRTPVRGALRSLQDIGFLGQEKNRGFFVAKDPCEFEGLKLLLPQTADEAFYQRIASGWFAGDIDQAFTEADLRRRYGIGREALSRVLERLVNDGIVARAAGKGYRFLPTIADPVAYRESYYYRQTIEIGALLSPAFRVDKHLVDACRGRQYELLYADIDSIETTMIVRIGAEFHELIGKLSGNRYLLQAIQAQNRLRHVAQYNVRYDKRQIVRSFTEHLAILDCIEEGDTERAVFLLRRHLDPANRITPEFRKS